MTDAGALEVTETIEHLELDDPKCHAPQCENKVEWLYAGDCPCVFYACTPHKEEWMGNAHMLVSIAKALGKDAMAVCIICGKKGLAEDIHAWPL